MELGELWKKLDSDRLSKPVLGSVHIQKRSKHPVQKLKNAYLITTGFSVVSLIAFIVLFFLFDEWIVKVGLVFMICSYIFFFATNFSMYRKVSIALPIDKSLKTALLHTYNFITENIRFQERVAVFIYPFATASGFLMGGSEGSGNVMKMFERTEVWVALIVSCVVLTPLAFYLTRWMYKVSYGKCLTELKARIEELERPD
ncbi:MAG: hypothetical protein HOP37_11690 [Cyclobacteriaceae bacterium]|nr:hypothetical protein [Cyclobacteriaceae bacterium]